MPLAWLRQKQFVVDGEAVVLGVDGISDFAALYSRKHDDEVQFYAFDMLAGDGDDMRSLPLSLRKTSLARLLARRSDGIFIAPFEHGEIGPDLFRAACDRCQFQPTAWFGALGLTALLFPTGECSLTALAASPVH